MEPAIDRHPAEKRKRGLVASASVALAVVVTVVGAAWVLPGSELFAATSEAPDHDEGTASRSSWQVLPGTFPVEEYWLSGPLLILPGTESCFVAFGQDNAGTTVGPGFWRSIDDCSAAVGVGPGRWPNADGPPGFSRGGVLAAVPTGDGGYLAIGRHTFEGDLFAYESSALYVDPYHPDEQERVRRLAGFGSDTPKQSHVGPAALVATETGYVAVGRRDDRAVAWTSPDGVIWRETQLPDTGLGEAPRVFGLAADPDGRLVAVGTGGTSAASEVPAGWVSTDAGGTWAQVQMPATGDRPYLGTVIHTGSEFVALGAEDDRGVLAAALVLTSRDGVDWTREESLASAGGLRVAAAEVLPDGSVIAVSEDSQDTSPDSAGPDERCASAWLRGPEGWVREPIGCHGIPTGLTVLEDGSVAAVHWSTLFLRPAPI